MFDAIIIELIMFFNFVYDVGVMLDIIEYIIGVEMERVSKIVDDLVDINIEVIK